VCSSDLAGDNFGRTVSIYSDTAVVGAYQQSFDATGSVSLGSAGAVYVFTRTAGVWTQQQKITGSGTNGRIAGDNFGYSMSIYSDTIVIGAYRQSFDADGSVSLSVAGAAYVYTRNTGIWTQQQKIVGSGTNGRLGSDSFGQSISIYSDTIVIGAYYQDYDAAGSVAVTNAGAAYVYTRTAGIWTQQQKLVGSGTNGRITSNSFGQSVSIYSDTIVIGTPQQAFDAAGSASLSYAGAAYVYTRNTGVWTQEQKLASNKRILAYFGSSICLDENCVIGAYNDSLDGNDRNYATYSGAIYVYGSQQGTNHGYQYPLNSGP
jgi:hypothetical protein